MKKKKKKTALAKFTRNYIRLWLAYQLHILISADIDDVASCFSNN